MARRYKTAQDLMNMSDSQLKRLYSWRSYEARKKLQRLEQKYGAEHNLKIYFSVQNSNKADAY